MNDEISHREAYDRLAALRNQTPVPQWPANLREALSQVACLIAANGEAPFFPPILYVEPTNACNCRCVICPRRNMTRPTGYIAMDVFRKTIDEAAELGPSEIRLFNYGEPLLHDHLSGMLTYCRDRRLTARFQTNGLLLNDRKINELLDAGLDYFGISVNGLNATEYETIRPGCAYTDLKRNLGQLRQIARQRHTPIHIHINAQIIKQDRDERRADIDVFVREWLGIADSISVSGLSLYNEIEYMNKGVLAGTDMTALQRKPDSEVKCLEPFDRLVVKWDGRVTVCCADYDARMVVGDITRQALADIWNSPEINRVRSAIRNGQYAQLPACRECPRFYSDEFTLLFTRKTG